MHTTRDKNMRTTTKTAMSTEKRRPQAWLNKPTQRKLIFLNIDFLQVV